MKRIIVLLVAAFCMVPEVWCQVPDNRKIASMANARLDTLMMQMRAADDSSHYYTMLQRAVKTAMLCDYYDARPNKKGKSKPRFRHRNSVRVGALRDNIADAGIYYYNRRMNESALSAFELYMETMNNPLFNKQRNRDGLVAYYASLLAYGMKDYRKANRYADVALQDDDYSKDAAEVKVGCMRNMMRTSTDSLNYLAALKELHDKSPGNRNYLSMLVEYFSEEGKQKGMEQFADEELRKYPNNKFVLGLKGEMEMRKCNWANAIGIFQKAVEQDSIFIPAIYNIGMCYTSQATELKTCVEGKRKGLSKDETKELTSLLTKSKTYLERTRRLDPQRILVDWAVPLYKVYFALGDKQAEEIKQLIEG